MVRLVRASLSVSIAMSIMVTMSAPASAGNAALFFILFVLNLRIPLPPPLIRSISSYLAAFSHVIRIATTVG